MPIEIDAIDYDAALPARTDVVVIGGGIAGIATALALAEKGIAVTVCEKGRVAAEQSSRNWGWTRVMGRAPSEIPLALESLRLWRGMAERVGADVGFRQTGTLWLCERRGQMPALQAWLGRAQPFGIDSQLLDGKGVAAKLPGLATSFAGGLYTATDGRAEPALAVPAMARQARRLGVVILGRCAARGVETSGGRVSAVVTEQGRIACGSVVLAGGAWSRLFCGNLGIDLPQLKMLGSVLRTHPLDGPADCAVGAGNFAFRKRLDGGYTVARRNNFQHDIGPDSFRLLGAFLPTLKMSWREVSLKVGAGFLRQWQVPRRWALDVPTPFEAVRELDPEPSAPLLAEGLRNLSRAFPAFAGAREAARWGCMVDATPDAVPVISAVAALPGFHIAAGFSGHGFGIGPGAGQLMADIVAGGRTLVDPAPYAFDRFKRMATSHVGNA